MSNVPVLVIGFNRPDLLNKLLIRLKELDISDLYVSLDGYRDSNDSFNCEQCINIVMKFSNSFNLHFIRRNYNLGCSLGVVSAIDWFFSNVEFGAIIEDDCLPKDGLFVFFEQFRSNKEIFDRDNVKLVTAHNPFNYELKKPAIRSILVHGWATHSKTWLQIRSDYFSLNFPSFINRFSEKRPIRESIYWWANSTRARLGIIDTWDGMLNDRVWRLGLKTLVPTTNLIINYGFGPDATHTKNPFDSNLIYLPNEILTRNTADRLLSLYYFKIKTRHIFSSLLRVAVDYFCITKRKNFEKILAQDKTRREIVF
jgi:hypothetical protein